MKKTIGFAILALTLLAAASAYAQQNAILPPRFDPEQPINIAADRLEADNNEQVVRFVGNVVAVQNDAVINCDLLVLHYEAKQLDNRPEGEQPLAALPERSGQVKRLLAIGRVQMVQGKRHATCDRAEYDHSRGTILLTGHPVVGQGTDALRGDKILIHVKSQRVQVLGGDTGRVVATINPQSAQEAAAEAQKKKKQEEQNQ